MSARPTAKRRFDSHVHTRYSPDGHDDMAVFAACVDKGIADGIGFACTGSHCLDTVLQLRLPFGWHKPGELRGVT